VQDQPWRTIDAVEIVGQPSALSDLQPDTSAGWAAPMSVSDVPGDHRNALIREHNILYVDSGYRNAGFAAAPPFQISWYVDGILAAVRVATALPAGGSTTIEDLAL